MAGRASGSLAEALRNLGRLNIDEAKIRHLKENLSLRARKELVEDIRYVPAWMRPIFLQVASNE